MVKKLYMGFVTTEAWTIARVKGDAIREVVKQSIIWNSLSIKEIEMFSEIEKWCFSIQKKALQRSTLDVI